MFTVITTHNGEIDTTSENETCEAAWIDLGITITEYAREMSRITATGAAYPLTRIRMVYMLGVPGVELEYANVEMA